MPACHCSMTKGCLSVLWSFSPFSSTGYYVLTPFLCVCLCVFMPKETLFLSFHLSHFGLPKEPEWKEVRLTWSSRAGCFLSKEPKKRERHRYSSLFPCIQKGERERLLPLGVKSPFHPFSYCRDAWCIVHLPPFFFLVSSCNSVCPSSLCQSKKKRTRGSQREPEKRDFWSWFPFFSAYNCKRNRLAADTITVTYRQTPFPFLLDTQQFGYLCCMCVYLCVVMSFCYVSFTFLLFMLIGLFHILYVSSVFSPPKSIEL